MSGGVVDPERATRMLALTRSTIAAIRDYGILHNTNAADAVQALVKSYIERYRDAAVEQTVESIITVYGALMFMEMVIGVDPETMNQPSVLEMMNTARKRGEAGR